MAEEIKYKKYEQRGSDFHYRQINKLSLMKFNAFIFAKYQKCIMPAIKLIKNSGDKNIRILDVGCGDGVLLNILISKYKEAKVEIFGIDSSSLALEVAKNKIPWGEFLNSSVYKMPFRDSYFDIIISSDVIEHLLFPEKMLKEIQRVGKSNSLIIIGTPIKYTNFPKDKSHIREFFQEEFILIVSKYFSVIKIVESHELFYKLLYEKSLKIFFLDFYLFRLAVNLISVLLGANPFLRENKKESNKLFSYMTGVFLNDK